MQILEGVGEGLLETQIEEVVAQAGAHQEFHGHVVDLLALLRLIAALEGPAAVVHTVADHGAQRLVGLLVRGLVHVAAEQPHTSLVQKIDGFCLIHNILRK